MDKMTKQRKTAKAAIVFASVTTILCFLIGAIFLILVFQEAASTEMKELFYAIYQMMLAIVCLSFFILLIALYCYQSLGWKIDRDKIHSFYRKEIAELKTEINNLKAENLSIKNKSK